MTQSLNSWNRHWAQVVEVEMYVEIEFLVEALDQSHCTGRPVLEPVSSFVDQMCRNSAVNNA